MKITFSPLSVDRCYDRRSTFFLQNFFVNDGGSKVANLWAGGGAVDHVEDSMVGDAGTQGRYCRSDVRHYQAEDQR